MKVKANKGVIFRHNNPKFDYRFKKDEIKEIMPEHWEYLKNFSYLELVEEKKKKKEVDRDG